MKNKHVSESRGWTTDLYHWFNNCFLVNLDLLVPIVFFRKRTFSDQRHMFLQAGCPSMAIISKQRKNNEKNLLTHFHQMAIKMQVDPYNKH